MQRRGLQDLTRLAISALRHVGLDPSLLQGMKFLRAQASIVSTDTPRGRLNCPHAIADRFAVEVHSAVATKREASSKLGAFQTEKVA